MEGQHSVSVHRGHLHSSGHTVPEVRTALETSLSIIRNILQNPKDIRMYRIKKGNPTFHRTLGGYGPDQPL